MITTLTAIVNTLVADGVVDFPANYKITDKTHVHVYYVDGLVAELELDQVAVFTAGTPNEFKVNAITDSGFNVELRDAYDTSDGRKISTRREVPLNQLVAYPPGNDFPAATHERALDKLTAIVQQFNETLARQISMPLSEDAETMELPAFIPNYYLGLNGDNELIWKVGTVAVGNDEIKDSHIDWGTGAEQVSAADMPIADAGDLYTAAEVEAALAEVIAALNTHKAADGKEHSDVVLNNTHRGSDGSDHSFIDQDVKSTAGPTFVDGKRLLTSANFLHGDVISYNDVFDKLSPFVPNTGEFMLINGGWNNHVVSRLERSAANTVTLYYLTSAGAVGTLVLTDGDGTTSNFSLSW